VLLHQHLGVAPPAPRRRAGLFPQNALKVADAKEHYDYLQNYHQQDRNAVTA